MSESDLNKISCLLNDLRHRSFYQTWKVQAAFI